MGKQGYIYDSKKYQMSKYFKRIGFLFILFITQLSMSQTSKKMALEKGRDAIKLMDSGQINESIELLEEAQKLDPERFDYPYEIAFAYYLKQDYKNAIKRLEKIQDHQNVTELLYQMMGNCYDLLGKTDKAFETYDLGLQKFPNSGIIYLEKGNVYWGKEEYGEALPYYEKGIEVDPNFASNYYRASRIYMASNDEIWGIMYGEIFMNLERNSKRTEEISKLLFDTYKKEIEIKNDTTISVSLCQQMNIDIEEVTNPGELKLPFCMVYEPTLLMSIINETTIDINSLDRIRSRFISNYYKSGNDKKYPNMLFEYQNKLLKENHLEAYNHWILMKGDEENFDKWRKANDKKWDQFINWFNTNGLLIDTENKFYSSQY